VNSPGFCLSVAAATRSRSQPRHRVLDSWLHGSSHGVSSKNPSRPNPFHRRQSKVDPRQPLRPEPWMGLGLASGQIWGQAWDRIHQLRPCGQGPAGFV